MGRILGIDILGALEEAIVSLHTISPLVMISLFWELLDLTKIWIE